MDRAIDIAEYIFQEEISRTQWEETVNKVLSLADIRKDAKKVRSYDHLWDMYFDEFEDVEDVYDKK